MGIHPPETLDAFTDLVIDLRARLQPTSQEDLARAGGETHVSGPQVPAEFGFGDDRFFSHGWEFGAPLKLALPSMRHHLFPGTWGRMMAKDRGGKALYLRYAIDLPDEGELRICFNTSQNCRVFLNGRFIFGRESGRMAPSPHRMPLNQAHDTVLEAGYHEVVAVLEWPEAENMLDWVIAVADRSDNLQWLTRPFVKPR